jgi:hypothetical protein
MCATDKVIAVADSGFDISDQSTEGPDPKALHHAFTYWIIDLVPLHGQQVLNSRDQNHRTSHSIFICGNIVANDK